MKINKYLLCSFYEDDDSKEYLVKINLRKNAHILDVTVDHIKCFIHVVEDETQEKESRIFQIFPEGVELKSDMGVDRIFIKCVQKPNVSLVYEQAPEYAYVFEYTGV